MWLMRQPLCLAANTQAVNAGSEACGAVSRQVSLTNQSVALLIVLIVGGLAIGWQVRRALGDPRRRQGDDGFPVPGHRTGRTLRGLAEEPMGGVVVTVGATLLAIIACIVLLSDQDQITFEVGANELALLALIVLAGPAWLVLRARDARRFALGVVIAAGLWLLIWYPNLTGLPLPSGLVNIYQGLLPTWNYAFQFATDMDPPVKGGIVDAGTIVIGAVTAHRGDRGHRRGPPVALAPVIRRVRRSGLADPGDGLSSELARCPRSGRAVETLLAHAMLGGTSSSDSDG